MLGEIMTEVSAIVPGERADEVPAAFAELTRRPLPDGLLRTELLAGRDGEWKIQSLWRDQAALDAMRAAAEPPAAPALFQRLGAEPVLRIYGLRGAAHRGNMTGPPGRAWKTAPLAEGSMSDEADRPSKEAAARRADQGLAYLCTHLDEIRALLADDVAGREALARLQSELRGGGDISGALSDIHDALLRAGDALGIFSHVRGLRDLTLAGVGSGPLEIVYRCPVRRCQRVVPGPAVEPPQCGVTSEPLRWGPL
jgi:hypothetical protein